MRWDQEKWRKLYRRVDAAWLRLPVLARGLGSELLKYAEDDGRIAVREDEDTCDAVCVLLNARRPEWKTVSECVRVLLADGFIVREPGAILIRNFAKAQGRSTGALRQARYRSRTRSSENNLGYEDEDSDVTDECDSDVTRDVTRDATVTPPVTGALHHTVTDRALSLSEISSDQSSSPDQIPPESARPRDSKARADSPAQLGLLGAETGPGPKRKRRGAEVAIPGDWAPLARHFEFWAEQGFSREDVEREARKFRSDAEARDKRFVRWDRAFDTWLERADPPRHGGHHGGDPAGQVSGDARVALEVFGEVWAARKRRPFVASVGDEKHAAALVEAARPHAAALRIAGREVVRFWAERYLGDTERFVADPEHPLRLLPGRLTTYGAPKPRKPPPSAPTAVPAAPPPSPAPPPPDLAAGLAEAARAAREGATIRRPGATP